MNHSKLKIVISKPPKFKLKKKKKKLRYVGASIPWGRAPCGKFVGVELKKRLPQL